MSVTLASILNIARDYLNDNNATTWTDPQLIPKSQEAFRELTNKLATSGSPAMRAVSQEFGQPGTQVLASLVPNDFTAFVPGMQNPIAVWDSTDPATTWIPLTETFNIPSDYVPQPTTVYWSWKQEALLLAPASANRRVNVIYRPKLDIPTTGASVIFIPFADLYMGARTAAIAAGSVGNQKLFETMSTKAKQNLTAVIAANRGQQKPIIKP